MAGTITTGNLPRLLQEGIHQIYGDAYKEREMLCYMIFDEKQSQKAFEVDVQMEDFGLAAVKPEGQEVQFDSRRQGFTPKYIMATIAKGFVVTEEALEDKMNVIKSLNRPYQTKSFTETLEKFDFEIPEEEVPTDIGETSPVAPEQIKISERQLVLMAEATEAADNLLNETLDKMLAELGSQAPRVENSSLFSDATDITNQDKVTKLLQIANERTNAVEDIRAIFQTMGLGS